VEIRTFDKENLAAHLAAMATAVPIDRCTTFFHTFVKKNTRILIILYAKFHYFAVKKYYCL
jgi:hypothetical protein